MSVSIQFPAVWVIDWEVGTTTVELLGDARVVADSLGATVGVLVVADASVNAEKLVHHGADVVRIAVTGSGAGNETRLRESLSLYQSCAPRLVLISGTVHGREWASMLAATKGWHLVSPALQVRCRPTALEIVGLDASGKLSRLHSVQETETVVATLRPGVGQSQPYDAKRRGVIEQKNVNGRIEPLNLEERIEADSTSIDIRHAARLVAGGRGVGGSEGFDVLRRLAKRLDAGIAASRMAVDLGWIERDRQVGQTGKTVKPELYIACGISGATHHAEGMSEARHIIAINSDPNSPIFKLAHLGLAADFRATIENLEKLITDYSDE